MTHPPSRRAGGKDQRLKHLTLSPPCSYHYPHTAWRPDAKSGGDPLSSRPVTGSSCCHFPKQTPTLLRSTTTRSRLRLPRCPQTASRCSQTGSGSSVHARRANDSSKTNSWKRKSSQPASHALPHLAGEKRQSSYGREKRSTDRKETDRNHTYSNFPFRSSTSTRRRSTR